MHGAVADLSREEVVQQNMGLVHSCAHRLKGRGIEYEDLVQAGCIGLMKAADAFDRARGVQFSTYAVPVILGEMRRLFRDGGSVKVSRGVKELGLKIARERERFSLETGREPTVAQLAHRLGQTEEAVAEAVAASRAPLSLTESEEEGGGQLDIPVDSPEEGVAERLSLARAMERLAPKDQALLRCRYFQNLTQTQTAQILGMTQVQVSRREKKILGILREELI